MRPLVVLRVGYMERYDGPATITSGGAYIAANGVGGEVFNFKPSRGKCYGYAMSRHFSGLNLQFIDSNRQWLKGDELPGVDVVFIARRPGVGQVVIGWYRNATVFHKQYRVRRGSIPGMNEPMRQFLCVADAASVRLLSEDQRTFDVPSAQTGHKGFPGQSNVWYPQLNLQQPGVDDFVRRLAKYISKTPGARVTREELKPPARRGGRKWTGTLDHAHNAAVEAAAIDVAWKHYEAAGYSVESVESDNLGWDLVASKGTRTLHIEVKGVSAAAIYFELTPNEYSKLKQFASKYRVCVVCDALTAPRLYELFPKQVDGSWHLASVQPAIHVPLTERIAAIGVEVPEE